MNNDCPHCGWRGARRFCAACGAALWSPDTDSGAGECVVVLSFDVDGSSGMINRDPRVEFRPSARSFGDYGPTVAVPHILAALARAEVPASFYVPGWVAERWPTTVELIAGAGHEIGHHGYLHEPPATLSAEEEAEVLDKGNEILCGITGEGVAGYRSPSWELSDVSLQLMAERGFRYDSSLMGSDAPYWVSAGESALVELPIHWALDDYPYFVFAPTGRSAIDGVAGTGGIDVAGGVRRDSASGRRVHADDASVHHWASGSGGNAGAVDRVHAVAVGGDVRECGGCVRWVCVGVAA